MEKPEHLNVTWVQVVAVRVCSGLSQPKETDYLACNQALQCTDRGEILICFIAV
jgi:hypothetical protein